MKKEALKKELKEVMLWGEETPKHLFEEVKEKGYFTVLERLKDRVSEWRVANKYAKDVVKEAKFIAGMEWEEVEKLVEEVFDEILKEVSEKAETGLDE